MDEMLSKIRNLLSLEESLDDQKAEEIILNTVLGNMPNNVSNILIEEKVKKYFLKTRTKLGILEDLIKDDTVNEIMINGRDRIFIEKEGRVIATSLSFDTVEELEELIRYIVGQVHREINEMNPIVDARLQDGSRIHGVYKNIALNGPILTIRKFKKKYITMDEMITMGTLTRECSDYLRLLVKNGYNLFISGGTSSGKTTFLNALTDYIPATERIVIIEDSAELKVSSVNNVVHMECRNANSMGKGSVGMSQLIKASLRMRPDRIIVGEVRGSEVSHMLQALNTGHDGSMSTGHGNSVGGMLRRLESMYLMDSVIPLEAIAGQIIEGIDVIVHLGRLGDGRRKVLQVAEIVGYESGKYITNELFSIDELGQLKRTNNELVKREKMDLRRGLIDKGL